MDKRLTVREKIETLADCLREMNLESIYIVPAVRELLNPRHVLPEEEGGHSH